MTERLAKLQSAMRPAGIDVLAVVPGANMRYLAGLEIHSSERVAVAFFPADGTPAMVLPALETPRAQSQARFPITFYPWDDADGSNGALSRCVAELGLAGQQIGVEYTAMRVLELRAIEAAAPGARVVDATPMIAELRMVKDDQELVVLVGAGVELIRVLEIFVPSWRVLVLTGIDAAKLAVIHRDVVHVTGARHELHHLDDLTCLDVVF